MVALIKIAVQIIADATGFATLLFRPTQSVQGENLFLRRQLALLKERGVQLRRIDAATRISLAILARFFEWRDALYVVEPKTMTGGSVPAARKAFATRSRTAPFRYFKDVIWSSQLMLRIARRAGCHLNTYFPRTADSIFEMSNAGATVSAKSLTALLT